MKKNASRFIIRETKINGLRLVETIPHKDSRGSFTRLYCAEELMRFTLGKSVVQINHSHTKKAGSIRGLHYQLPPNQEIKYVRCIKGAIWDVVVDMREESPTYLQWHGEKLSPENLVGLIVPEGFAHGFQSLEDDSEMIYFACSPYSPESESGANPFDPKININWPLQVTEISEKDKLWTYQKK